MSDEVAVARLVAIGDLLKRRGHDVLQHVREHDTDDLGYQVGMLLENIARFTPQYGDWLREESERRDNRQASARRQAPQIKPRRTKR